jgi:hypothetical protein
MTTDKLLKHFRNFYFQNYPDDMETLIDYFGVFGGLDLQLDTTHDLTHHIVTIYLQNYTQLSQKIEKLTLGKKEHTRLLHALAVGDRRIFRAFNKAGLNNGNGGAALEFLQQQGLIEMEYSREMHPRDKHNKTKLSRAEARHRISHKVLFSYPFLRFWFYFIFPHAKEIEAGEFSQVLHTIQTKHNSYTSLIFEELSTLLLNYHLREEHIETTGSYWDAKIEIDILTTTSKNNIYVAECKWTNHKVNKKELHKLKDKLQKLNIDATQIIFFSKRGFSKEMQQLQSKELALFCSEDFKLLLKKHKLN